MSLSGVKVTHESGGKFAHNAVVTPTLVTQTECKCDQTRKEIMLVDSSINEHGPEDCAMISCGEG